MMDIDVLAHAATLATGVVIAPSRTGWNLVVVAAVLAAVLVAGVIYVAVVAHTRPDAVLSPAPGTAPVVRTKSDKVAENAFAAVLALTIVIVLPLVLFAVESLPSSTTSLRAATAGNIRTLESHYGVNHLRAQSDGGSPLSIVADRDEYDPIPVTFMDDGGPVHGDVVVDGDRATLYVGSDSQRTEYDGDASTASGEAGTKGDNGRSGDSATGTGHNSGPQSDATPKER